MLLTPQGRVIGLALSAATLLTTQYDKVVDVFNKLKEAIFGVKKEQEGLDFSVQNQGADPSKRILAGMTSGKIPRSQYNWKSHSIYSKFNNQKQTHLKKIL